MRKFFSLIEMLIVIVVLGILAAIIIPNVADMKKESISSHINANTRVLQTAVDTYSLKNEGELPVVINPTLTKPQYIDIERLYPTYIKSKLDYNKIKEQKYWVDVFGRVWGATEDGPDTIIQSINSLEFNNKKNAVEYKFYEIESNQTTSSISKSKLREAFSVKNAKEADRIKVDIEGGNYLVSSIDTYGLESAPVGLNYQGYKDDWFQPLLRKEGVFEFEIESPDLMYWDDFYTIEDTPEGTSINISFSYLNNSDEFTPYTEDFYSLSPSTHLKIKIEMKGANGKLPSLYDMRVLYHYEEIEKATNVTRIYQENVKEDKTINPSQPTVVIDEFVLPKPVKEIKVTDSYSFNTEPQVSYFVKKEEEFVPITSFSDLQMGSTLQVKRYYPKGEVVLGIPSVLVKDEVKIQKQLPITEEVISKPSLFGPEWDNVGTMRFFAHAGDGQAADWISADIKDVKPENTDILYIYSYSNSNQLGDWVGEYKSIDDVPNSKSILVTAYLLVKKEHVETSLPPEVNSVKITHTRGDVVAIPQDNISNEIGSGTVSWNTTGKEAVYDGNLTTYMALKVGSNFFDLGGDLTNRTLHIVGEQYGYYYGNVQFLDRYNRPIYTVDSVSNQKNYTISMAKKEVKVRVPRGAVKINIQVAQGSGSGHVYVNEIKLIDEIPLTLNKVEHTATDYSITLNWEIPNTSNYDRVAIFENNVLVGTSNTNTFIHKPLISDTQHTYQLVPISKSGVVGLDTYFVANTKPRAIKFSGINPIAFDRDYNNYIDLPQGTHYVDWEGNLEGQTLYIKANRNNYYTLNFAFVDVNGNTLSTVDAKNNVMSNSFGVVYSATNNDYMVKVPKGADRLRLSVASGGGGYARIFEIEDRPDINMVISNVNHTATDTSITLNWKNPTNVEFSHVAIFKSGKYVGTSSSGTFTETPLMSDTLNEYTLYPISKDYVISEPVVHKANVLPRPSGIKWNGLSPIVFDHNLETYHALTTSGGTVTWTGDLSNKTVAITSSAYMYWSNVMTVLDTNGKALSFTDPTGTTTYTSYRFSSKNTLRIKIPENAAKIQFSVGSGGGGNALVYEITEE